MTAVLVGCLALAVILMMSSGSSSPRAPSVAPPTVAASTIPTPPTPPTPPPPGAQWDYYTSTDDMTSKAIHSASVTSTNTVSFDFPYQGEQHGKLTLRLHPRYGKDVIFRIERGQLQCSSYEGCTVLVRFDEGAPQEFSANGAESNDTEVLFISNYARFLAGLQRAKIVRIAASVYQEGSPAFEFSVDGLALARLRGDST